MSLRTGFSKTGLRLLHAPRYPEASRLPASRLLTFSAPVAIAFALAGTLGAQQLIGYVSTRDADVTGASDVMDSQAVLVGSVGVTAKDHTASITLGRGGSVRVCQTSVLHVSESRAVEVAAPLLFSLDRGALEIQTSATATDAIMTPDLRFTVRTSGPLDLRLRVGRNGDTCVENRGPLAPTLAVSDPFGESMYELAAGQHVLFEHGSLREVVDHETSPCGCPDEKGLSVADALLAPGPGNAPKTATPVAHAAEQHPFPAAISEGLAPTADAPPVTTGPSRPHVTEALHYPPDAAQGGSAAAETAGSAAVAQPVRSASVAAPAPMPAPAKKAKKSSAAAANTAPDAIQPGALQTRTGSAPAGAGSAPPVNGAAQSAASPARQPQRRDLAHVIGRFFKKIFG
jgi:hypothetical protein